MTRYIAIPRSHPKSIVSDDWVNWGGTLLTNVTVHDRDEVPVKTGLVDAHGTDLYRLPQPRKIGFIHF